MNPKGKMIIIGGAEDKGEGSTPSIADRNSEYTKLEILKELVNTADSSNDIEIITTATEIPDQVQNTYMKSFKELGYDKVDFMYIENKHQARDEKNIKKIKKASAVFFTGGNQFRISTIIGGTPVADAIRERYFNDEKFLVAGTSSGAMAIAKVMICWGGTDEALLKEDLQITSGLGLLDRCIVDTHFIKRGRFGRLAQAVVINPELLGIGLGEDTALIISNGYDAVVRGSGMVIIIDGKYIEQTNITEVGDNCPIFVENLKVHILVKGCRFDLKTRKLANPAIPRKYEFHDKQGAH